MLLGHGVPPVGAPGVLVYATCVRASMGRAAGCRDCGACGCVVRGVFGGVSCAILGGLSLWWIAAILGVRS